MFKFLLTVAIIYMFFKYYKKSLPDTYDTGNGHSERVKDVLVKDPNCGRYIPRERAVRVEFNGKIYYFCSLKCANEYEGRLKNEKAN